MDMESSILRNFAVVYHPDLKDAGSTTAEVVRFLRDNGAEVVESGPAYDSKMDSRIASQTFDLLIALGGDGTMLRAGHLCAPRDLPLLGINMGHFGFLTEVGPNNWKEALISILAGRYRLEDRMMLKIEHFRADESLGCWQAINEVVICRGQFVRPIQLSANVDGYHISNYVADGLIVATPTGSTAYALAAGGPILPPEIRNLLIIPVAPHLSMDRAIILPEGARVSVTVKTSHEAVLSVDGHPPVVVVDGDRIESTASDFHLKMVRLKEPGYFYKNITLYMENHPSTGNNQ